MGQNGADIDEGSHAKGNTVIGMDRRDDKVGSGIFFVQDQMVHGNDRHGTERQSEQEIGMAETKSRHCL